MSRYLDDTYNLVIPVLPPLSSQCLTLGSRNFNCKRANIFDKITKKLDSIVKYWNDTILFSGSK
ncbi:hypothetical protein [Wolbachia endosymbiont (group A) of Lasioglossum morio]|uniref:hypothetical protein n=1 Tax=Wolbachia endosymbiont (group A) of Lasioglossum morio TaxID=2954025 RepID=UPI003978798E